MESIEDINILEYDERADVYYSVDECLKYVKSRDRKLLDLFDTFAAELEKKVIIEKVFRN